MPRAALAFLTTVATALAAGSTVSVGRVVAADRPPPAAAAAAERGWFGLARELWEQGGGEADEPAGFLPRLDHLEREVEIAALGRDRAEAHRWATGPSRIRWRHATNGAAAVGPPAIAGELVLWNTGAAIHAVRLLDGRPPWSTGAASPDTRLFPRGSGRVPAIARGEAGPLPTVCAAAGRAHAVLARGAGESLVCLDLSPAAEGRLVWLIDVARIVPAGVGLPEGPLVCDGPPIADHELCCVVLRAAGDRDELVLAAFAAADGRLDWVRRCGTAIAADGRDHGRGRRRPVFVEDRIVLATHAGAVVSFDRDGRPAWRTEIRGPAAPHGVAATGRLPQPADGPDALGTGGFVLVAPRTAAGVVALDARRGAVVWQWTAAGSVVGLAGTIEDGVVVATRTADETTVLVRLDRATGRERLQPVPLPGSGAGPIALVDRTLFRPRTGDGSLHGAGIVLDLIDAASLATLPGSIDTAANERPNDAVTAGCFVAGGSGRLAVAVPTAVVCIEAATGVEGEGEQSR